MDWSTEAIERLKALCAEGHSTAEIGRRMGISKNAVVGKAHRLSLSARPSPIRRDPAEGRPAATRAPRPAPARATLPPPIAVPSSPVPAPVTASAALPTPSAPRIFSRLSAARSCCWPIGEPGAPGFRFCAAVAASGKPYCTEHAAVAYVKPRDRREDAA